MPEKNPQILKKKKFSHSRKVEKFRQRNEIQRVKEDI